MHGLPRSMGFSTNKLGASRWELDAASRRRMDIGARRRVGDIKTLVHIAFANGGE
jgi:hypothetical protein